MDKRRNRCDETWFRLKQWVHGQKTSERLAACLIANDGYKSIDPSHPLGGKDGLKDVLCRKNGMLYVAAAYFPREQQTFKEVAKKYLHDAKGVRKNGAIGFVFVTNQELSLSERRKLQSTPMGCDVDMYHLERITSLLNLPQNYGLRLEFLDIALEKEEQLAYFAFKERSMSKIAQRIDRLSRDYRDFKDHILKRTYGSEMRTEDEIRDAVDEHFDRIWHGRHQLLAEMVRMGKDQVEPGIWKGALKAAKRVERLYGKGNLGPYSDFEWGMINGKLSALRWVMGDEWDMLDT